MELHRLRASQVSAAQPLKIIYHSKQVLSNEILVVIVVYAIEFVIISFVLKFPFSLQNTYPYTRLLSRVSSTGHTDY